MKTLLKILALVAVLASSSLVADESSRVDFKNDLVPLFTKSGCNAGACHGAAIGRGGFKLSLYGGNPEPSFVWCMADESICPSRTIASSS